MSDRTQSDAGPAKTSIFVRSFIWSLLLPIRAVLWILTILFVVAVFSPVIFVVGLILRLFVAIFDLIFRLNVGQSLDAWAENFSQPIAMTVSIWAEKLGITMFFASIGNVISNVLPEIVRGVILFVVFLAAGFAVYHLRIVHRLVYAALEFLVAVTAMWIAIDGMAGGDFSLGYLIALVSGLYIMVRALQNADDGLREIATAQVQVGQTTGSAQAWLELWRAVFYEPYRRSTFTSRSERIKQACKIILSDFRKSATPHPTANEPTDNTQSEIERQASQPGEDPRFKEINARIIAQTRTRIIDQLAKHRYKLVFNPETGRWKPLTFMPTGEVGEGRNNNEFKWRVSGDRLEILNDRGEVYSRFFTIPNGTFQHTNDSDTWSIKGQYLEPLEK